MIVTPPAAWLVPAAAALAVVGTVFPWFRPHVRVGSASRDYDGLYSVRDGKIGLLAPIVLVVVAVMVVGLLRGRARGRLAGSVDPVRTVAKYAIGAGAASLVCVLIAWFLVSSQYRFTDSAGATISWDGYAARLASVGGSLSRGPQPGYWLTVAAAALAVVGGALMLAQAGPVEHRPVPAPPST